MMKKITISTLILLTLSGCSFTKWQSTNETRDKGVNTYVSDRAATGRVLAIQSAELSSNGVLEITAQKFLYGSEYSAPVVESVAMDKKAPDPVGALLSTIMSFGTMAVTDTKKLGKQTIGETRNERVTASYTDTSRESSTGNERWDYAQSGTYEVVISSTKLDAFKHRFNFGKASLNLVEILSKQDGNRVWIKLECPECSESLPADLPAAMDFQPLSKEIKFEFNVAKLKASMRKDEESKKKMAREQELQAKREQAAQEKRIKEYEAEQKRAAAKIAREGDGSPDDITCKKYGIKPNTPNYGTCRMQLDMARKQAQAVADQQQRQYEAQQRQYEADLAAQKAAAQKERDRKVGMALIGIGTGMMGGKSASSAISDMTAPVRPTPPSNTPQTQIITLPNSRPVTCTTVNNVTNCM